MTGAVDYKQAVILSGGGAYGAYEVGVMKALFTGECPSTGYAFLKPGIFTGTSVGAINAAAMVSYPDVDICSTIRYLESVWLNVIADNPRACGNGVYRYRADPFRYLDTQCVTANPALPFTELADDSAFFAQDWFRRAVNFLISAGDLESRTLQLIDFSSLISSAPLTQTLGDFISLAHIRRSHRKLRVVATNWDTGEVKVFQNSDMTDDLGHQIIRGSAALPGVFPPSNVANEFYVDGGLVMNTPLNCAIQAGGTTLHVIYMDPDVENIPLRKLQSTIDTLDRVYVINFAAKMNQDIKSALWINEGLEAIERANEGSLVSGPEMQAFIRVANQIQQRIKEGAPYKKLTIHRYHPHDDLGGGTLGLLNFNRDRMAALIERGFNDTLNHDCVISRCILPGRS